MDEATLRAQVEQVLEKARPSSGQAITPTQVAEMLQRDVGRPNRGIASRGATDVGTAC
jgi:hypothetical protein